MLSLLAGGWGNRNPQGDMSGARQKWRATILIVHSPTMETPHEPPRAVKTKASRDARGKWKGVMTIPLKKADPYRPA